MIFNRRCVTVFLLCSLFLFGGFSCAMNARQECTVITDNEPERAVILSDVRADIARIIACEEVLDEDRSEGEKLIPYLQSLESVLDNDVPLVQNAVIATVAVGSTLLFYQKSMRRLEYIYPVREPVQQLSLDEDGSLHLLFASGEEFVWQKRMPRTCISENILDEVDVQR